MSRRGIVICLLMDLRYDNFVMRFDIISIFPESFYSYLDTSILKKAIEKKIIAVSITNPRDFTTDKHHTVDESPYGGGPGMVLKAEPIWKAVSSVLKKKKIDSKKRRIVLFSTRGKKFDQKVARRFSKYEQVILICGRYEGVDERVAEYLADEEISMGDYVLSGGELPALVFLEAVSRHIPGVLGKYESLEEKKGSYPVYTRPEVFEELVKGKKRKMKVPEALLRGNHKLIEEWRKKYGTSGRE